MIDTRLIYISRSRGHLSPQGLQDLAAQASLKNAQHGITGVLVKMGNYFVQVLEGPEAAVMALMNKISRDARHTQMRLIYKEPTTIRTFAQWSMGSLNLDNHYEFDLKGYRELREQVRSIAEEHQSAKGLVVELLKILPGLLETRSRANAEA